MRRIDGAAAGTSLSVLSRLFHVAHLLFAAVLLFPQEAGAHARGESYVFLNFRETHIDVLVEFHYDDMKDVFGIDVEAGPSPAEVVKANEEKVLSYIRANFSMAPAGRRPYELAFLKSEVTELHGGLSFAMYRFRVDSGPLPDVLDFEYSMCFEKEKFHRGLVCVDYNAKTGESLGAEYTALVFSPFKPSQSMDLRAIPGLFDGKRMVLEGARYFLLSPVHALFAVLLLIGTVVVAREGNWVAAENLKRPVVNLLVVFALPFVLGGNCAFFFSSGGGSSDDDE